MWAAALASQVHCSTLTSARRAALTLLQEFRQEEFVNGSALRLECNCRGDLALRHRECVMKWVQVRHPCCLDCHCAYLFWGRSGVRHLPG